SIPDAAFATKTSDLVRPQGQGANRQPARGDHMTGSDAANVCRVAESIGVAHTSVKLRDR
ncbi:MAG TPA: hypothetical protein VFF72_09770, partial [Caldimonas sp.]|nr:hypothetical protein [Caldimonas sp.]